MLRMDFYGIIAILIILHETSALLTQQVNTQGTKKANNCYQFSLPQLRGGSCTTKDSSLCLQINPAAATLLSGSIAGAIGVGVAFPLDTLKTKSQVLTSQDIPESLKLKGKTDVSEMNMLQLISFIYSLEGIRGFFGGVKGMMIGQALIKAVAFGTNSITLAYIRTNLSHFPSTSALLIAACTAGLVTSFLVTPIERVKVMMQASSKYRNELSCLRAIVETEGLGGLMTRGLGTTLGREIPSYGIYFFMYGFLSQTPIADALGMTAPLFFGALSGMASWIPVYPIDVVKTLVQNTDGSTSTSSLQIAGQLYSERGIGGFFDGITPKMLRAAVNHAVTFYCYDIAMNLISGK